MLFRALIVSLGYLWFNTIIRRVYSVQGPNSLWHIDGLHCLIRWRFVDMEVSMGFPDL